MGVDFVSDCGEFPPAGIVNQKAGKSVLQARLTDPPKWERITLPKPS